MRLINVDTLQLEAGADESHGYAALSHTWTNDANCEITFREFHEHATSGALESRASFRKVKRCCEKAATHGLRFVWADTCCIDQSSSAELSRSINSMFRWYKESAECLVYLSDVSVSKYPWEPDFRKSRWFQRGWTLQELIAPSNVIFYDRDWIALGTRKELSTVIHQITRIPESILIQGPGTLSSLCVAQKMSWASTRQTSEPEDIAYCLFGLFGVNMPLTYGEGAEKAFLRLQEAILKDTDDESIFAWEVSSWEARRLPFSGLLAKSPNAFNLSDNIRHSDIRLGSEMSHITMSKGMLDLDFRLSQVNHHGLYRAYLDCAGEGHDGKISQRTILLQRFSGSQFCRVHHCQRQFHNSDTTHLITEKISVKHEPSWPKPTRGYVFALPPSEFYSFQKGEPHAAKLEPVSWYPGDKFQYNSGNGDLFFIINDENAVSISPSELSTSSTMVRSILDGVVTIAVQVNLAGKPRAHLDNLGDDYFVETRKFDVLFGYECLDSKQGSSTQRLFPWCLVVAHQPIAYDSALPSASEIIPAPGPLEIESKDHLKVWRDYLDVLVKWERTNTFQFPVHDWTRPVMTHHTFTVNMTDELFEGALHHNMKIRHTYGAPH